MRTKWAVLTRVLGVIMLLVVGLGSSWGRIHPVLAEAPAQGSQQEGLAEAVPVEVTLGEPVVYNTAPKEGGEGTQPETSVPALPDPYKVAHEAPPARPDSGWAALMTETFEGIWPAGLWQAIDGDGTVNDEYDIDYRYLEGQTSGVMAFTAPEEPGSYDLRMNDTDQDGKEVASITFTVE